MCHDAVQRVAQLMEDDCHQVPLPLRIRSGLCQVFLHLPALRLCDLPLLVLGEEIDTEQYEQGSNKAPEPNEERERTCRTRSLRDVFRWRVGTPVEYDAASGHRTPLPKPGDLSRALVARHQRRLMSATGAVSGL